MIKRFAVCASISAVALFSGAQAGEAYKKSSKEDFARAFPDATVIDINEFTGRIEIAVGGDETAVILTQGNKSYSVDFTAEDSMLTVRGEERPRGFKIHKQLKKFGSSETAIKQYLKNYPVLKISIPAGVDFTFDDVITVAVGGDTMGNLEIDKGYVEALFGNVKSAEVGISSSGSVSLGEVAEHLKVGIGGSGDFDAVSAHSVKLDIGGSGDIQVGKVKQDAVLTVGGSGDISTGNIGGLIKANVSGSGNIMAKKVGSGAALSIAGSGDIILASVNGPTKASIAGNGDIRISGGVAKNLNVQIAGNGEFDFDGSSTNLDVSIIGSGSVDVRENTGTLKTSNRNGDIRVNGKYIKPEKHGR